MSKTWTMEDQGKAQARELKMREICDKLFSPRSQRWFVEMQIRHLQELCKDLPGCYKSFKNSLTDFYVDFSWKENDLIAEIAMVLVDSRFPKIKDKIQKKYHFDLDRELRRALKNVRK